MRVNSLLIFQLKISVTKSKLFFKQMNNSAENVWKNCLVFIKDNIDDRAYETWFAPIVPIRLKENSLTIQVPSRFFMEWLDTNYVSLLKLAVTRELGDKSKLYYAVKDLKAEQINKNAVNQPEPVSGRTKLAPQTLSIPVADKNPELKNPFVIPGIREIQIDPQLNPNQNFDNFVEGDSNRLARSAGIAVANKPGGTSFNPLFIFGGVGLGKTHLAQAIGVEIKEKHPRKKVLYVSAEKFTQQYTESVRNNTRNDFIHFYQLIDVLIVDDIQFFASKSGTQDTFFHIFNHLHQNNKQIILTSDKAPVDMQEVEQRLLSRFKWGLSAELQAPDFDTRFAILKNKFQNDGAVVSDEIIQYLAENVKTNVRELEGVSNSLIAQAAFNRKEFSIELARNVVEKMVKNQKKEITIDSIQKIVSDYFNLDLETLQSKTRKRHVVQARQLAMFFAKKYTKESLSSIGNQIGKRDHATVLHACKTVEDLAQTDRDFQKYMDELNIKISN
ncbi:Chromosomal replication initiator protein DnaA [Capnocytophaga canimorsus]|nr:Chromosomal replication initiator protein DnaA [Capnocytophaga canimorsus]